ncbi:type III secretion system effector protein [Candidatus Symbiopectobacterium sp. 'North America']|uniref:type III secretion system effector protein n=1 Tax=Candidatus Symbiopectobacterium sp. 'North America' TaxID=2794574 RepID=UPI0018C9CB0F|nr:type III secretion system effector protein [Candidatus Symbiopectobacterium sp. 'North America']MBG6245242.1 type III secretion system effector protein [Candidatus Symbiopectobacterium sp. 'North America']
MSQNILMDQNTLSIDLFPVNVTPDPLSSVLSQKTNAAEATKEKTASDAELNEFFAMFDQLWGTLLNLARRSRDVMRMYNEKKQILGWGLEMNALSTSLNAIEHSYSTAKYNAGGTLCSGLAQLLGAGVGGGAAAGTRELITMGFNGSGSIFNEGFSFAAASENRKAEIERELADFQSKNAQSYIRNLDDIVQKAIDVMQQMMEMGRKMVEVYSQTLHYLAK